MPVRSLCCSSTFHDSETSATMRSMFSLSRSGSISDQVEPSAVGAIAMKPRVRASRSQLHRNAPPLPLPPCSPTTSGQARAAS
jgi:hypothetical protein